MINYITILVLNFFDYFYKKKLSNFIKKNHLDNINVFLDENNILGYLLIFF